MPRLGSVRIAHNYGFAIRPTEAPTSLGHTTTNSAGRSSATLTTTAAIRAGNLVVIGVHISSANNVGVSSISDGTNTYTLAGSEFGFGGNTKLSIYYKANAVAVGSGATITVTYTGASGGDTFQIETAQLNGYSILDQTSQGTGALSSGTLASANEVLFGYAVNIVTGGGSGFGYKGGGEFITLSLSAANNQFGNDEASALDYDLASRATSISYNPFWVVPQSRGNALATFR